MRIANGCGLKISCGSVLDAGDVNFLMKKQRERERERQRETETREHRYVTSLVEIQTSLSAYRWPGIVQRRYRRNGRTSSASFAKRRDESFNKSGVGWNFPEFSEIIRVPRRMDQDRHFPNQDRPEGWTAAASFRNGNIIPIWPVFARRREIEMLILRTGWRDDSKCRTREAPALISAMADIALSARRRHRRCILPFFPVTLVNPRFSNFHIYQRLKVFRANLLRNSETPCSRTEAPPLGPPCSAVTTAVRIKENGWQYYFSNFILPFNYSLTIDRAYSIFMKSRKGWETSQV